ncbi:CCA tRNA nucleotidyltransferase [Acidithiobacillus ferriphilus]|uniref:CCA tRNA nucleotidyltransferase n=1 Tax=Acidithiobacillus ferriphilus TaxID=1689834 RepID=UPI00390C6CA0
MLLTPPAALTPILTALQRTGARVLVVGGTPRDALLGVVAHDWDLEIYGLGETRLAECLEPFGAHRVGGRCAVWVTAGAEISLPQATGGQINPHLPWAIAAQRRDFSVNALAWDWQAQRLLDHVGGVADIHARRLRVVATDTFGEDPLRVFRAARLAGQLGFSIEARSATLCRQLAPRLQEIPQERIRKEWEALLLRGQYLVRAWDSLVLTGAITRFPELRALQAVPQRPDAHPEGDAWIHTGRVLAAAGQLRCGDKKRDIILMLGALLHDLGKASTTRRDPQGCWRACGHEEARVAAETFLSYYFPGKHLSHQVLPILRWHAAPYALHRDDAGRAAYARLALQVPDRPLLLDVALADARGAGTEYPPAIDATRKIWQEMNLWSGLPDPLLNGSDLMAQGLTPGPQLGKALALAHELQVSGGYHDRESLTVALHRRLSELSLRDDRVYSLPSRFPTD